MKVITFQRSQPSFWIPNIKINKDGGHPRARHALHGPAMGIGDLEMSTVALEECQPRFKFNLVGRIQGQAKPSKGRGVFRDEHGPIQLVLTKLLDTKSKNQEEMEEGWDRGFRDVDGHIEQRWRAWHWGHSKERMQKYKKVIPWGVETYYRRYQWENLLLLLGGKIFYCYWEMAKRSL